MANTPWWQYPLTQLFGQNGEQGVDVGTPLHTPITNLYGGKVVEAQYGAAGGIVGVLTTVPGLGSVVEYFLHLDTINVKVGQQIGVGDLVGLSGGELAGTPGGLHPASSQFSSGPHTEFGFFRGTPFASADAGNPLAYLHPSTSTTTGTGGAAATSSGTGTPLDGLDHALCNVPLFGGLLCLGQNAGQAAGQAGGQALQESGVISGITLSIERIGFFVLALVIALIGVVLITYQPAQETVATGVKSAVKAAEVA